MVNENGNGADRRLVAIMMPFILLLALLVSLNVLADEPPPAEADTSGEDRPASITSSVELASTIPTSDTLPMTPTVTVSKTVTPEEIWLDATDWWVTYDVVFSTTATQTVTLTRITDTLPVGFVFGNMVSGGIPDPVETDNNELVWQSIPFTGTLTMRYNVRAVESSGDFENSVVALVEGQQIGPASATLQVRGNLIYLPMVLSNYTPPRAVWEIDKTANSTVIEAGDPVDYQVVIKNTGNIAGSLGKLVDTLPGQFTFGSMLPGGDVNNAPSGTTGAVTWEGNWTVEPGDDLTLRYRVTSGGSGEKTNTLVVYSLGGGIEASGSATVVLGGGLPFIENFENGASSDWKPFVNYAGLSTQRWYWAGEKGVWGIYNYDTFLVDPPNEGFDLSYYDGSGAQGWKNYRIETRLKDVKTQAKQRGLTGFMFRGTVQPSGSMDGKTVRGYYVYIKPGDDHIYLMRTLNNDQSFASQDIIDDHWYQPGIGRKHWYKFVVEVKNGNIKVLFEDDEDGTNELTEIFNWTDPNPYLTGTVGFAMYYSSARFDYMHVTPLP